ncbi:MAG: hypothetical protein WD044_17410 [Dongiaceae bacterium]
MIRTGYVTPARPKGPFPFDPEYRILFAAAIVSAVLLVFMLVDAVIAG